MHHLKRNCTVAFCPVPNGISGQPREAGVCLAYLGTSKEASMAEGESQREGGRER